MTLHLKTMHKKHDTLVLTELQRNVLKTGLSNSIDPE